MFDRANFDCVVRDSGFSKGELGVLYGVSRQTIYNWIEGGGPTQPFVVRHAEVTTAGVLRALAVGVLPLPPAISKKQRVKRLNAMVQALHVLAKPTPLEVE